MSFNFFLLVSLTLWIAHLINDDLPIPLAPHKKQLLDSKFLENLIVLSKINFFCSSTNKKYGFVKPNNGYDARNESKINEGDGFR